MLIPVSHLKRFWKIEPQGSLHVGAHFAEEQADYQKYGFEPVTWIEAQPELAQALNGRITSPSRVIQALAWNNNGEKLSFKITNNGQSSSIFDLGSHENDYPGIKVIESRTLLSSRLDSILPKDLKANFINLDIQGAEYEALEGLGDLLSSFKFVYSEVSRGQVYKGIKQITEIDSYLDSHGFVRVATRWTQANWGDALYLRQNWAKKKFGSIWSLKIRIVTYWVWCQWADSLWKSFFSRIVPTASRFSRNKFR